MVLFGNGYDSQNGEAVLYALRINSDGSLVSRDDTSFRNVELIIDKLKKSIS